MLVSAVCRFPCGLLCTRSATTADPGREQDLKAPLLLPLPPDPELQAVFPGSPAGYSLLQVNGN